MAIIEELGLEVKVQVGGAAVTEYTDPEPDVDDAFTRTTKACHYVESVDNAEFAIYVGMIPGVNTAQEWICGSRTHGLSVLVEIDGDTASKLMVHQDHLSELLEGIHNGEKGSLRKFRFASVSTVDDSDEKRTNTDLKAVQYLGLIRVTVFRCTWKEVAKRGTRPRRSIELGTNDLYIAEKALKGRAISHGTALSDPILPNRKPITKYVRKTRDSRHSVLAVFDFKYRSKEALQQIIPLPRNLSAVSDLERLSPQQIRGLALQRLSQIKSGQASIKAEDDSKVVKPKRPSKEARTEGEQMVIDLTGED